MQYITVDIQRIYINWNLGSHTYTMTVHLTPDVEQYSMQSLTNWVQGNSDRIVSWEVDDLSWARPEQYDAVRALINNNLPQE